MTRREIWKTFNQYEVSNRGNVRSKRFLKTLKPIISNSGYARIQLGSSKKKVYIHRLVALSFLKKSRKKYVNHIDGNKLNNYYKNLEWCTPSENRVHALKNGLQKKFHINNKLSEKQVRQIKRSTKSSVDLSKLFLISPRTIRDIRNGVSWKTV